MARSAENLGQRGAELGKLLTGGTVIVLSGPLGAGKTTFVQGLARGMGIRTPVTSPTFALIQVHEACPLTLVHCDFYRLQSGEELEQLGLWEYFTPAHVVAIEWGQEFLARLPEDCVQIEIIPREGERVLQVSGATTDAVAKWVRICQS
ncbi:MAG: tRNA threonylcarbamoyladenosine biosynthesis protein TsaE [Firmicutes bacterium]|nr:tRNA threonylcarbamoyladenosine biosynthesis protein TsaE [candidate division NPL-UPA2 bacterium]MBT9154137.1 tRNA threonylcarbamoyladenosine biosynthesis protein TsaE [candidate division NPL-UPA2 bacterium]MBT9156013.1 tRNA threonylcarbamoyladenosine biosynthesis protein TsaE [candidate division NPL-UPA2 bacterium]